MILSLPTRRSCGPGALGVKGVRDLLESVHHRVAANGTVDVIGVAHDWGLVLLV